MILLLLAACTPEKPVETGDSTPDAPVITDTIRITPRTLDFGVVGAPPDALSLTVHNDGAEGATIADLSAIDGLSVSGLGEDVPAGGTLALSVDWTPESPTTLDDAIGVVVSTVEAGVQELSVPVTGVASWPVLSVEPVVDVGEVSVGCTTQTTVLLTNAGTEDLHVSDVALADGARYALSAGGSELPAFPWTVVPGASATLTLTYTPSEDTTEVDLIAVASDDPLQPLVEIAVMGTGGVNATGSVTHTVGELQRSTALFVVNELMFPMGWGVWLEDSLPTFFETMQDSGASFRVAFIKETDGKVTGDIPYIDETYTTDEAMDAFYEMMNLSSYVDNDVQLATFSAAIPENEDWLLDESEAWKDSRLSLIGITGDTEKSTSTAVDYVAEYQAYKDDPSDAVVHGIGGIPPRGCGAAFPAQNLFDAANLSYGQFFDYCAVDWTITMEDLAKVVLPAPLSIELDDTPVEDTITVALDGVDSPDGWSYNADTNAVTFDSDARPDTGVVVQIDYVVAEGCVE